MLGEKSNVVFYHISWSGSIKAADQLGLRVDLPSVLLIPLLSDPTLSDPPNPLSNLILLTLRARGEDYFPPSPPPWPRLGWWRLVPDFSAEFIF